MLAVNGLTEHNDNIKLSDGQIWAREFIELDGIDKFSINKDITKYSTNFTDCTDQEIINAYPRKDKTTEIKKAENIDEITISIPENYTYALVKWLIWDGTKWVEELRELELSETPCILSIPTYIGYFNVLAAEEENDDLKLYALCPINPNKIIMKNGKILVNNLSEIDNDDEREIHKIIIQPKTTKKGRRRK